MLSAELDVEIVELDREKDFFYLQDSEEEDCDEFVGTFDDWLEGELDEELQAMEYLRWILKMQENAGAKHCAAEMDTGKRGKKYAKKQPVVQVSQKEIYESEKNMANLMKELEIEEQRVKTKAAGSESKANPKPKLKKKRNKK